MSTRSDSPAPLAPAALDSPVARGTRVVEFDIQGMTCASCVGRIERKLSKVEGVEASVNLALESAKISAPEGVSDQQLMDVVQAAGYVAVPQRRETLTEDGDTSAPERNDHLFARFLVAAILTVPVLIVSMVPGAQFPHWGWWAAGLTLPVVTWAAWPFHRAAAVNARHGASTMDTLVSIGVIAAYAFSLVQMLVDPALTAHAMWGHPMPMTDHQLYFEVAAVVTTFLLLGRWLEHRARRTAADALRSLLELGAKTATLVSSDGSLTQVPAASLAVGDLIEVRPGEKIAADGVVESGSSAVDAAVITGESLPVEVGPGSVVTGATINASGRLLVRVSRVGQDSTLAAMGRMISEAQTHKAPITRLADRISAVFVPIVLALAAATFLIWWLAIGDLRGGFVAAVTVLVIACPCALGLATPVALVAGTGRGSQLGILLSGPQALEEARGVDVVVLDKTGTLTEGRMALAAVSVTAPDGAALPAALSREDALRLAGAAESGSEHPIARAISDAAGVLPAATDFVSAAGGGVAATVEGHRVVLGKAQWLRECGVLVPAAGEAVLAAAEAGGATAVYLGVDGELAAVLSVTDTVKASSADGIRELGAMGVTPWLLTGDNASVAATVAAQVGIAAENVIAGVLPEGKVAQIRALQAAGHRVAMVGDGVNDAPALAAADLGLAMGSGTDVARQSADIELMGSSVTQVAQALGLSRATLKIIRQNLFWAFSYNVLGIPVAALGLLNPMIAGAAMAASSVIVVTNALRLRRWGAAS